MKVHAKMQIKIQNPDKVPIVTCRSDKTDFCWFLTTRTQNISFLCYDAFSCAYYILLRRQDANQICLRAN